MDGVASREDLNQLFREMTGHLSVGHTFVGGGTQPKQDAVGVGLLGADYRIADGRYQFARILSGGTPSAMLKPARWRTTPWLPDITV